MALNGEESNEKASSKEDVPMKKFIVSIVILLLVAVFVFYWGWIQFLLPEGTYGVIFTKTSGWDDDVVAAGQFLWRWERLVPTNFSMHIFDLKPRSIHIQTQGELPSGSVYREYIEENPDFSYTAEIALRYEIDATALPLLVQEHGLRPETLDSWYEEIIPDLETWAVTHLLKAFESSDPTDSLPDLLDGLASSVRDGLEKDATGLTILSVSLRNFRIPDPQLYALARENYRIVSEATAEAIRVARTRFVQHDITSEQRLETLKQYAAVLDENPVLLEYFKILDTTGRDPLNLQVLGLTDRTE
jgi:hypothetical protein